MKTRNINGSLYPVDAVQANVMAAQAVCIRQGAACKKDSAHTEVNDYLIMLSCEGARQRGATSVDVQRNV